jgi:hypothetical protein
MSMDSLAQDQRSRRAVLAAAAGSAAALVAGSLARPLSADAASAALMTEVDNATAATTSITSSVNGDVAAGFETTVAGQAAAIHGHSPEGIGVHGTNPTSGAGVVGDSDEAVGVFGRTGDPSGYPEIAGNTAGVIGYSGVSGQPGVLGVGDVGMESSGFIGMFAVGAPALVGIGDGLGPPGSFGTGVYGYAGSVLPAEPPNNIGVYARGDGAALALKVQGKTQFSRSGRSYVAAGQRTRAISVPGLTAYNLVIVTLQTYRSGVYVAAAVPTTGKFTVNLNKAVTGATYFAWFIIN